MGPSKRERPATARRQRPASSRASGSGSKAWVGVTGHSAAQGAASGPRPEGGLENDCASSARASSRPT
eukprot:3079095-Lingulodinium_polyedra.AAC.1